MIRGAQFRKMNVLGLNMHEWEIISQIIALSLEFEFGQV